MNESFNKAMEQAWAVYFVLKYQKSMSALQAKQCQVQLSACLDYLAAAKATVTDEDLVAACDEAIADTTKCADSLKELVASVDCQKVSAAKDKSFKQDQFKALVKHLYWL